MMSATMSFAQTETATVESQKALTSQYCAGCHNDTMKSGGFSLSQIDLAAPEKNAERVERVIRKVRSGMMPPAGARRPDEATLKAFASGLEARVDAAANKQVYVVAPELHRVNPRNTATRFAISLEWMSTWRRSCRRIPRPAGSTTCRMR